MPPRKKLPALEDPLKDSISDYPSEESNRSLGMKVGWLIMSVTVTYIICPGIHTFCLLLYYYYYWRKYNCRWKLIRFINRHRHDRQELPRSRSRHSVATTTPLIFTTLLAIDACSAQELTISRREGNVRPLPRMQGIIYKPHIRHKLASSSVPPAPPPQTTPPTHAPRENCVIATRR